MAELTRRRTPGRRGGHILDFLLATPNAWVAHIDTEPAVPRACPRSVEGGSVDELLDVTLDRPVLEQLQVEVGRTLKDGSSPV